jgi:hypothetical protein
MSSPQAARGYQLKKDCTSTQARSPPRRIPVHFRHPLPSESFALSDAMAVYAIVRRESQAVPAIKTG